MGNLGDPEFAIHVLLFSLGACCSAVTSIVLWLARVTYARIGQAETEVDSLQIEVARIKEHLGMD